eukprot:TRINITY_DN8765_c0_g1_i12.p1 TRINITY_DN8765_c0_g1~~TRINITY_DN8765_c0_g1_i12.p1  ORF type:complete len:138 (+),score=36.32 TRINITY_DN8765_c0_g1_i12:105-518(+)
MSGTAPLGLALGYGLISFGSAALNTLFVTYYLDWFIAVVKVPTGWFYGSQLVFMVWNAVNDPLFGWISDTFFNKTSGLLMQRRLRAVLVGGILWACAFVYVFSLSLIHISEPTRLLSISYAVFCLKKKKKKNYSNVQ